MKLARKGQEINAPEDAAKDPLILEFLGPESEKLIESDLETALINNTKISLRAWKRFCVYRKTKTLKY